MGDTIEELDNIPDDLGIEPDEPEDIGETETQREKWRRERYIALEAIRKHIEVHGKENWKLVRDRFPDIGERRWWRLIAKVSSGQPTEKILAEAIAFAKREAKKHIPAPISPAVVYSNPDGTRQAVDFLGEMAAIKRDIAKLRDFSLSAPDANGEQTIKNPMYFTKSVQLWVDMLERQLDAYKTIWDMRKMEDLYNAILAEISEVDPEMQKRIILRMHKLNMDRGMTFNGR